jgi:hypothetical protein
MPAVKFTGDLPSRTLGACSKSITPQNHKVGVLVGHPDGRWLRRKRLLRNLLTHYLPDPKTANRIAPHETRIMTIEKFADKSFDQVSILVDRYLSAVSVGLQQEFKLTGDPFWLGKVSR